MAKPIFFDPTGARKRWSMRGVLLMIAAIVLAAVVFASTILNVPAGGALPIRFERVGAPPLSQQIANIRHGANRRLRAIGWLPRKSVATGSGAPTAIGFYVPWDDASGASLRAHIGEIDWVVPALLKVSGRAHAVTYTPDVRFDAVLQSAAKRPLVLPMVQNSNDENWDGAGIAAMLRDPKARARTIAAFVPALDRMHAAGLVFDFEDLPASALGNYRRFLAEAHVALAAQHRMLVVTVPAGDPDWDIAAFAQVTDRVILMNYDEHWETGTAGPIASQAWFVEQLRAAARAAGPKLIVAIGSYAYDWGGAATQAPSIEEALLIAHDSGSTVTFDPVSGNSTFAYRDDDGDHRVWMLDAASAWNQLRAVQAAGISGVALWRLGSEDPGVWPDLSAWRKGGSATPDLATIRPIGNVDVEGNGEILRVASVPRNGQRRVVFDPRRLIRAEDFTILPTPYIVEKTGYSAKQIALTFDDGPDPTWTPRILDVLASRGVPGTFFVIGENALAHPLLLRRIVDQGGEIGNHTYTHPDLSQTDHRSVRIELNTTQRLIEAYTGRSTRLFRAPYFGDAEPTTPDELGPALQAQERGYTVVGLHVDPNDWQRPGVQAIVNQVVAQVEAGNATYSGNIVLLHDGGGDRAQTLAALPQIIDTLRAKGYSFVPASALAGLTRAQVMPRVKGGDLVAVRADIAVFTALAVIAWTLKWLFFVAIALGIGRAILLAVLALWSCWRNRAAIAPDFTPDRLVSVIIPAWNEETVIVSSVTRVLASRDARIEVIVADDGSADRTSALVSDAFGDDPRVRLLTLVNGGKAAALNKALALAKGEIVVALDADTQFEPETVARLVRWFADPAIGAVAGNAKVGNRVNLATRWQAVEYVTAQNVERRALAQFDAMMVVPGAVGAWRREALDAVGGYPEDTLAEDQDLTIAIQRAGWRVAYDIDAVAWTEAPQTFRALARQRFRWAFGTLQCLWKHRAILRKRRPAGLALVGMPQAWLFQILFAAISPVIDLALVISIIGTALRVSQHGWAQTESDVLTMGLYWLIFTGIDVLCGWIAYRLEPRERRYPAHLLIAQRFIYRQLMYWVVLKAIGAAVAGFGIGWGKLERTGTVTAEARA